MRFWVENNEEDYPWMIDYPSKLVSRFWGVLDDEGKRQYANDMERYDQEESSISIFKYGRNDKVKYMLEVMREAQESFKLNPEKYSQKYEAGDDFDFIMLRMGIIYSCRRRGIACALFPKTVLENRYKILTKEQLKIIYNDLTEVLDWHEKYLKKRKFNDDSWWMFYNFIDENTHYNATVITNEIYKVFKIGITYYNFESFIESPCHAWLIPSESIVSLKKIV
jgi:hypothetical protein